MQVDARGSLMLQLGVGEVVKPVPEWNRLLHPSDRQRNVDAFARHIDGSAAAYENEFRVTKPGGDWIWIFSRGKITDRDHSGKASKIIGTFMDISRRKRDEEALARATRLQKRSGEIAKIGGWTLDIATGQMEWTDEVYRIHELDRRDSSDLSKALDFYTEESVPLIAAAVKRGIEEGESWDLELEIVSAKGRHLWVRAQGEPVREDGVIAQLAGAFQDISDRKRAELELQRLNKTLLQLSYTDALTGLGNRRMFDDVLDSEWHRAARSELVVSMLMIDVDYFKLYNDLHGHLKGDGCLQQIAMLLTASLRRTHEKAFRYGGEEFAILLPDTDLESAKTVARRLLEAIQIARLPHGASPLGDGVSVSIGVASMTPSTELDARLLTNMADTALYRAKAEGRARVAAMSGLCH
jgi:diguanylate cyclase (GGDEF)-like protein